MNTEVIDAATDDIAIIGMSGRFPDAPDLQKFWHGLCRGMEAMKDFTPDELRAAGVPDHLIAHPDYVKTGIILEGTEEFDAGFFGMSAREAETTDPQQRIFLECAWEALEDAAYDAARFKGAIGVFASANLSVYLGRILSDPDLLQDVGVFQAVLGCDKDYLPLRVAYKMNLRGPAVAVQSSCSSSLVAVHMACQSLLSGECQMALAGGVKIGLIAKQGYMYQRSGILSPDGRCRPFDAKAQGTIGGSGVGVVVLRRLDEALRDGDFIYAVIKGSAVNNDGARKIGYTAPSVEGQAAVIREALALAGLSGESIQYVEAHGTGTALGDPVEIAALVQAFASQRRESCALGSVKSNLGHLDSAAGIAGLIKTVLSLWHGQLVPTLHYTAANPQIHFEKTPFYVNSQWREWPAEESPRHAAVSSFGIGGTNAHVVLEEAPSRSPSVKSSKSWHVVVLSGRSETALQENTERMVNWLEAQGKEMELADIAYSLQVGRHPFEFRRAVMARSVEEASAALRTETETVESRQAGRAVGFVFPGQGAQRIRMGMELYKQEGTFRAEIDRCATLLGAALDPRRWILGESNPTETSIVQPLLFCFEYALARTWMNWGIRPEVMIGHSLGEYVAACLAQVLALEDALQLVKQRGKLMQELPPGGMLAVADKIESVEPWITKGLWLAATNGPRQCVVSGDEEAIRDLQERLTRAKVRSERLPVACAFHSGHLDPMIERFVREVEKVQLRPPQIPFISGVTGTWITGTEATSPAYWGRQARERVRFKEGIQEILREPERVLLEVGPGRHLAGLMRSSGAAAVISSLQEGNEERDLQEAVAQLWTRGVDVDWTKYWGAEQRRRVRLPAYAFQRQRYWLDKPGRAVDARTSGVSVHVPYWKRNPRTARKTVAASTDAQQHHRWLIWDNRQDTGMQLALQLPGETVRVKKAGPWQKLGQSGHVVRDQNDLKRFLAELDERPWVPDRLIYFEDLCPGQPETELLDGEGGFESLPVHPLLVFARALSTPGARNNGSVLPELVLALVNGYAVLGEEAVEAQTGRAAALRRVIANCFPQMPNRVIDLGTESLGDREIANLRDEIISGRDSVVAFRKTERWVLDSRKVSSSGSEESDPARRGIFLITGDAGPQLLRAADALAARKVGAAILGGNPGGSPSSNRGAFPSHSVLAQAVEKQRRSPDAKRYSAALDQQVRRLCALRISNWLSTELLERGRTEFEGVQQAKHLLGITPRYDQLFNFAVAAAGWENASNSSFHVSGLRERPEDLVPQIHEQYPEWRSEVTWLDACLAALPDILREQRSSVESLFRGGSSHYDVLGATDAPLYCQALIDAVQQSAAGQPERLRVLEVGGGDGFFARVATPVFQEIPLDYEFTDKGSQFVRNAEEEIRRLGLSSIRCARFDISVDPLSQRFVAGSYDLIVALNCIHATEDIQISLRNLKMLLRPGGSLALIETTRVPFWVNFVWGLTQEWWNFRDRELRKNGPTLTASGWQDALRNAGFEGCAALVRDPGDDHALVVGWQPQEEHQKIAVRDRGGHLSIDGQWRNIGDVQAAAEEVTRLSDGLAGILHFAEPAADISGAPHSRDQMQAYGDAVTGLCETARAQGTDLSLITVIPSAGEDRTLTQLSDRLATHSAAVEWGLRDGQHVVSIECFRQHDGGASDDGEMARLLAPILNGDETRCDTQIIIAPSSAGRMPAATSAPVPQPEVATPAGGLTAIENYIASIWKDLLKVREVTQQDDFFALGGDSLAGLQVIARIRQHFSVDFPVAVLFEEPTLEKLARRIEVALASRTSPAVHDLAVSDQRSAYGPLSSAQKRFWFLERLNPGSSAYNIPAVFRVSAEFDPAAYTQALDYLRRRHAILRSTFPEKQGFGVQVVHEELEEVFRVIDVNTAAGDPEEQAVSLIRQEMTRAFDLSSGPPWRVTAVRTARADYLLVFVFHHIVLDGWSISIFFREAAHAYQCYSQGKEPDLPPLPLQYSDYAAWQEGWLHGPEAEAQWSYWEKMLGNAPAMLKLKIAEPSLPQPAHHGATTSRLIREKVPRQLKTICREHDVTPFMALLAAFEVLLYHYSGQNEFLIGSPVAGRRRVETEALIGCFLNTIVLRASVREEMSFAELLAGVRRQALEAYANQDFPLEMIVERLQPARSSSENPMFQVMCSHYNVPPAAFSLPGLAVAPVNLPQQTVRMDIVLIWQTLNEGLYCNLEYRTDLFKADAVAALLEQFEEVLKMALSNPEKPVKTILEGLKKQEQLHREAELELLQQTSIARLKRNPRTA